MKTSFFTIVIIILSLVFPGFAQQTDDRSLKEYLEDYAGSTHFVSPLMVPFGRSPEGQHSDFANPRVIISFRNSEFSRREFSDLNRREFMAYSKNDSKLQSIRWNEDTRQFDFLVDPNYNGKGTPNFQKADESSCIQCHQNKGPIFPRGQWSEFGELDGNFISPFMRKNVVEGIRSAVGTEKYLGFKIGNFGLDMEAQTDASAKFVQAVNVCNSACGSDKECRRAILKLALRKKELSRDLSTDLSGSVRQVFSKKNSHSSAVPIALNVVKKNWPEDEYKFPDWSIGDRVSSKKYDSTIENKADPKSPRQKIHRIPKEDAAQYIADVAADCMGLTTNDLKLLKGYTPAQIDAVLDGPVGNTLIEPWPRSRKFIMNSVMAGLKPTESAPYCDCDITKNLSPVPESTTKDLKDVSLAAQEKSISELRPVSIKHFQFYCGSCHANGVNGPKFPLDSESAFKKYITDKNLEKKFEHQLSTGGMPSEGPMPPKKLNELMIQWLPKSAPKE